MHVAGIEPAARTRFWGSGPRTGGNAVSGCFPAENGVFRGGKPVDGTPSSGTHPRQRESGTSMSWGPVGAVVKRESSSERVAARENCQP